ncbi:hypothetical protein GQ55_2G083500 [Panicum hallii var. hallii]|uniref:Uncharacterized protein n=1 Tax=Panicum hallii var. hallii TaxID=1504633 RepID=A0A2T7EMQ2_9POAL|nr:hypothetical protein GQ55_2G083500 [Panicum hallii var. hallii]
MGDGNRCARGAWPLRCGRTELGVRHGRARPPTRHSFCFSSCSIRKFCLWGEPICTAASVAARAERLRQTRHAETLPRAATPTMPGRLASPPGRRTPPLWGDPGCCLPTPPADASKCRSCSSCSCSQGYSSPADLDDESSMICSGARVWSLLVLSRIFSIGMESAAAETEAKAVISFMVG